MSPASPLPSQPLQIPTLSEAETRALKQQVTHRLREHRQRRGRTADPQPSLPLEGLTLAPRQSRVANTVAARFANSMSYREFLQHEAEAAVEQAAAMAEMARRSAQAVACAQQELLQEMEQWSDPSEPDAFHVEEIEGTANTEQGARLEDGLPLVAIDPANHAVLFPLVQQSKPGAPVPLAERLKLQTSPVEPAVAIPANLIEFPRQLVAARRARPRLAEGPLREEADAVPERAQLRIFEVEANTVSITPPVESVLPEWHSIRLDGNDVPHVQGSPEAQTSLSLPVFVAPVPLRAMAAIVDGCCVATAFLLAVAVAAYASPVLPTGLYAAVAASGALFALAMLYLLLFFTLDDATPGMRYARIGFCTFADENPTRASIRRRIFALLLAALPLGLGVVWACMDEDGLGWHDRISRMYPRAY